MLLLSDRTLYILQNLAALDIGLRARWMADSNVYGYYPPEPGSEDDVTFRAAVALAQEELSQPMQAIPIYLGTTGEELAQGTGGGGPTSISSLGPDEGLVWHLTSCALYHDDGTARTVGIFIYSGGSQIQVLDVVSVVPGAFQKVPFETFLQEDQYLVFTFYGMAGSKTVQADYWGIVLPRGD